MTGRECQQGLYSCRKTWNVLAFKHLFLGGRVSIDGMLDESVKHLGPILAIHLGEAARNHGFSITSIMP